MRTCRHITHTPKNKMVVLIVLIAMIPIYEKNLKAFIWEKNRTKVMPWRKPHFTHFFARRFTRNFNYFPSVRDTINCYKQSVLLTETKHFPPLFLFLYSIVYIFALKNFLYGSRPWHWFSENKTIRLLLCRECFIINHTFFVHWKRFFCDLRLFIKFDWFNKIFDLQKCWFWHLIMINSNSSHKFVCNFFDLFHSFFPRDCFYVWFMYPFL